MTALKWDLHDRVPADWEDLVTRLGGGFFHSPPAVERLERGGSPIYAVAESSQGRVAMSLCVRRGCRLSILRRHAHVLSLPAVAVDGGPTVAEATRSLLMTLRSIGVAQVVIDSFDTDVVLEAEEPLEAGPRRTEFRVPIGPDVSWDDLLGRMKPSHRRRIRAGEARGWALQRFEGSEAADVLALVQASAVRRRVRSARTAFVAPRLESVASDAMDRDLPPWGVQVFGAVDGDEVLSAALIGWAGSRVFYILGGSTPAGYEQSAAFWMHSRVMHRFGGAGLQVYNLGGVPSSATEKGHAQHGLFRFKEGFGADPIMCGGGSATLHQGHAKRHALASRFRRALPLGRSQQAPGGSRSNRMGG